MKILLIAVIVLLQACTTYSVVRSPDGTVMVDVKSTRSFEAPDLHYARSGEDAEFDFSAANADNNTDALVSIMQMMMDMLIKQGQE